MEEIKNYTFVKVEVFPPSDDAYYQLYVNNKPTSHIYSQSHLSRCYQFLNSVVL